MITEYVEISKVFAEIALKQNSELKIRSRHIKAYKGSIARS